MPSMDRGTTDVTRYVMVVDNADGSPETGATITNFNLQYTRVGEAPATKVDATALGTTSTVHTDNKMIEVDATDSPGLYRVDWPDAAFATGATGVLLVVTSSDAFAPAVEDIQLRAPTEFSTGAAISVPPKAATAGFVITWGENEANDEDSTHALDGVTHDIEAANDTTEKIDVYYEFTIGGDGVPTGCKAHQRLDRGGGQGKNLQVYAYDWGNTTWDQIGLLESGSVLETDDYTLFASHVGTGSDLGKVRIRYETGSVAFSTTTKLLVDQILVEYTIISRTVGYANGAIWIDTNASNTNTENFIDGTADNPVSTIAAAITIATSLGLNDFHIINGSTITLAAAATNYSFFGDHWTLALGTQSMVGIHVEGADVTGVMAGTGTGQSFHRCTMGACSLIAETSLQNCRIAGTLSIIEAGAIYLEKCYSGVPAGTIPSIGFGAAIGNTNLHVHHYNGGLQVEEVGDNGTDTVHFDGIGHFIEGTCTGGAVTIQGVVSTSGITNLTVTEVGRVAPDSIGTAAGMLMSGTSTGSSTTSKIFVQATDPPSGGADDDYNGSLMLVWDTASKSTGRVGVRIIEDYDDSDPSFTISPVLGFTPGAGDLVEIWKADNANSTIIAALAGGFGTTSPDRLIDHLRSIMSKGAVTPASLGTYDPAADSLEFSSERRALIEGSGFSTSTDSLKAIRDAIDTLVAPAVVSASSLSGSGFLSDVVSLVRKATDEPSQSPKYTDGDIVELMQAGMDAVMTDIQINTDHPFVVRYSITLVDGTQYYILPPNVAELMRVAKISSTGAPEYEVWPGSHMNPSQSGWKLEGNVLRLLRDWNSTDTLELMYMPNSEPYMHKGTAEAIDATTVTLMAVPTDGTLGRRPNEYTGMLLRILSSDQNYAEERMITGYDLTTRIATVAKAWDTTPTGTVVYEVVPIYSRTIKHVVALRTAIDLLSQEGNSQRMATLNQNYAVKLSAMRRQLSKMEGRFPHHFDGDTWDNTNRQGFY